jgi:hypothetical protein
MAAADPATFNILGGMLADGVTVSADILLPVE